LRKKSTTGERGTGDLREKKRSRPRKGGKKRGLQRGEKKKNDSSVTLTEKRSDERKDVACERGRGDLGGPKEKMHSGRL